MFQPEKEIEEIWRQHRVSLETSVGLMSPYSMGSPAMYDANGLGAMHTGVMTGGTVYGAQKTSPFMQGSKPNSSYSLMPYFAKGSSSSSYSLAGLGKGYAGNASSTAGNGISGSGSASANSGGSSGRGGK